MVLHKRSWRSTQENIPSRTTEHDRTRVTHKRKFDSPGDADWLGEHNGVWTRKLHNRARNPGRWGRRRKGEEQHSNPAPAPFLRRRCRRAGRSHRLQLHQDFSRDGGRITDGRGVRGICIVLLCSSEYGAVRHVRRACRARIVGVASVSHSENSPDL